MVFKRRKDILVDRKDKVTMMETEDLTTAASSPTPPSSQLALQNTSSLDIEINNQTILFSIKLLCKRIGEQNPLSFVRVIKFLSENLIEKSLYIKENTSPSDATIHNVNLLSSVLLCIGEVCLKLKSNALAYLNQIMIFVLDIVDIMRAKLGDSESSDDLVVDFEANESNVTKQFLSTFKVYELLMISCVTCLVKVVQNLANFLSPYLPRLFYISCALSYLSAKNDTLTSKSDAFSRQSSNFSKQTSLANSTSNVSSPQIDFKLSQLRSTLATLIPLRLLTPLLNELSLTVCSATPFDNKKTSQPLKMKIKHVEYYMQMSRLAVQHASQEDLLANIRILRSMFMNLFEMRTYYVKTKKPVSSKSVSIEAFLTNELTKYENHVVIAFCEMTFKLSEDLFKPIFFRLYEWATINNPSKERQLTFYNTTLKLSDKLKNLFVLFASQFIQNASDLLNQLNSSKTSEKYFSTSISFEKEHLLLYSIVDTLSNVFLNDSQRTFVNKERFNLLMEPLVDQIENEIEYADYTAYVQKRLGPCIANLASCCVHDDTLCRKFNYQILLKTKSSSSKVRLATLDVLEMFSKKVGDIYNSYLSETVPFLAELMEDPVDEVEEKVQYLIKELEDMLGESLQSHFV